MLAARFLTLSAVALTCGGCAFGNQHGYHDIEVPLTYGGSARIAVATYDQRTYVRAGDKSGDFVGVQRAGFGNPFDVRTESGYDLAYDFTLSTCATLKARGYQVSPVAVEPGDTPEEVLAKLGAARGERSVILAIREWRSDTYSRTGLAYSVTLKVLDQSFAVLGEARLEGEDDLGGSAWNPPAHAREAVRDAFARKLQWLLSHPSVVRALATR